MSSRAGSADSVMVDMPLDTADKVHHYNLLNAQAIQQILKDESLPTAQPKHAAISITSSLVPVSSDSSARERFLGEFWLHGCPHEIMQLICCYMPADSLYQFAQLNKRCAQQGNNKTLWVKLLLHDFSAHVPSQNPKKEYLIRKLHAAKAKQLAARQAIEKKKELGRRKFSFFFHLLQEPCFFLILVSFIMIFTILLIIELNKHNVTTEYINSTGMQRSTVWPIVALPAFLTFLIAIMCYVRYSSRPRPFHKEFFEFNQGPIRVFMEEFLNNESILAHTSFCLMLSLLATTLVFIFLRVCAIVSWSWIYIFVPFFVAMALWCISPWLRWARDRRDRYIYCLFSMCIVIPLSIFIALLVSRLDNSRYIAVSAIFAPLYFLDTVALVLTIIAAVRDGVEWFGLWLCLFSPMLIFKVLLSVYFDKKSSILSWSTVFIPIYFLEFLGCAASSFYCAVVISSRRYRYPYRGMVER
jgi:hypothetical protein